MTGIHIDIDDEGLISIDIDAQNGITIAVGSRRLPPKTDAFDVDALRKPGNRQTSKRSRALLSLRRVTPEMEAAGVRAFLAGADTAKLGRALAAVFEAMEAAGLGFDDEDGRRNAEARRCDCGCRSPARGTGSPGRRENW